MGPGREMRRPQEAQERIERLRDESRQAKEQGRVEDARRLWEEADAMEMRMQQEREIRSMDEHLRMMRGKVRELREEADRAEREGREPEARELRENAERIEREAQEAMHNVERMKMEGRLKQLHMMIEQAKREGDVRRADALAEEAGRLKQRLGNPPAGPQPREEELMHAVEGLKREVMQLRQEVNELRNRLGERPR
jgi:phage shock protein A